MSDTSISKTKSKAREREIRWRVLLAVGMLYAAQFVPMFFALMALPVIMRQEGYDATTIGLVQLAALPYVIKFLWAPLIDKYKLGRDRYKSWIVVLSIIHLLSILALSTVSPSGSLVLLFAFLFIACLSVSTQDVAVDALAISLLRPSERAMGATFQNAGAYGGAVIGGFGFLFIYGEIGWTVALLAQAVLFGLPLLVLLFVDEPVRLRGVPPINLKNCLRFFTQARIWRWLGVLASMRMPLIATMLPMRLMMVDQGMTTQEIALWFGLFAMSAGGGATIVFGPLLRNLPRVRALYVVAFINVPVLLAITYVAGAFPSEIRYAIIAAWMAIAATDIVIFRGAMDKVRPEIPGFDFSVQIAIYFLLPAFSDPVLGYVIDMHGYLTSFLVCIPFAFVPIAFLYFAVAKFKASAQGLDGERSVSTGTIPVAKPRELLEFFDDEIQKMGLAGERPKPDILRVEEMGCIVEIKTLREAVDILVDTPNENFLILIRDEVVEIIERYDAEASSKLTWTGGISVGERPSNFRVMRAKSRKEVFPGLIRVTLEGIDVQALTRDGIHIRLMMPEKRGRTPVWPTIAENGSTAWPTGDDKLHARWVTIREIRMDEREIDVDIAHHAGGLISDWAALDGDEQEVGVIGPSGDPYLEETKDIVLAADYTGLPAVARLIESTGGRVTGHVFAAAPSRDALAAYLPPSKLTLVPIPPEDFTVGIAKIIDQADLGKVSYGWFGGEFKAAQAVRSIFKTKFGLQKRKQMSVAFWRSGVPGHASRAT